MHSPLTRRVVALVLGAIVVAAGLSVHAFLPDGFASDAAGDMLYAVLMYLLVVVIAPRLRPLVVAGIALAWCVAVELFQLTGLPDAWGAAVPPLMLVFGTVFAPEDLAMYAVGIAASALVDLLVKTLAGGARGVEAGTAASPGDPRRSADARPPVQSEESP